ncbi:hypothetical protein ACFWNQ_29760, partial [Streptomyces virginiae]|uniref:hypothetical protein n=1 Tax=Streptomyces virginiae TaxID=1961 RepID=UPI00365158CA
MTRSAQRAAPGARLLLLAALLLGIVTMHTLGHPTESHAMQDVSPAHSVASAALPAPAAHGGTRHTAAGAPSPAVPAWGYEMPATEMDPMSVCLAVGAGGGVGRMGDPRPAGPRAPAPGGGGGGPGP